ncbi:Gp15 family bacteriophage protein [Oscillibacter sp. GMB15532]|uniref:Gp15 family bacteriophage protein n=1 Tax=Oscillibacter sp. GMB15532 TaxID=3230022 RepID=UPI0034DFF447
MNLWSLPESAELGGREYAINADFRDVLDIISHLNDTEQDQKVRTYVALALFYNDFGAMPQSLYQTAAEWMVDFINCGEPPDGKKQPKTIDWEQDKLMIVSDINKVAGCEIRALPFCHWWTFIAWFNGVGEGQLSTVVSIREKRRKGKKLTDWEHDFYKKNREKVDFKTQYTQQDDAVFSAWTGKKGPPAK